MESDTHIILALYANPRGLGYACMEMPASKLMESGVINVTPLSNEKILKRVHRYIDFYRPHIVVIRDSKSAVPRVQELSDTIATLATSKNLPLHRYTRRQVKDIFEVNGAKTKFEIAHKIIKAIPELASRTPKMKKSYLPEDYNMGVFDAVALIMTHEYLIA